MEYEAPTVSRSTIISDGYGSFLIVLSLTALNVPSIELNVQEIRPPRMDDSGRVKYPVLFRVCVILSLLGLGRAVLIQILSPH